MSEHGAESSCQTGRGVRCAEEISRSEEGGAFVIEACYKEVVPQRVELGTAAVEQLREVAVEVGGVQTCGVGGVVGLSEGEVGKVTVEVLHVGDVAAEADD